MLRHINKFNSTGFIFKFLPASFLLFILLTIFPSSEVYAFQDMQGEIHNARVKVDEAWEHYHNAALSGTLASPELQTEIEMKLHQARSLLNNARDYAEKKRI